ncbi:MAG: MBL fold metallo-hydrolase [Desulforhopalus sp.]
MSCLTQHTINTPYMIGPVHCYTGKLGEELVLFDTGPPTPEARQYLETHIDLARLKHIFITHCHIDHYGQTHWLEQHCDAAIYLPYRDGLKILQHDRRMEEMYYLLSDLGFNKAYLDSLQKIFDSGTLFPPFPEHFLAAENDMPNRLGVEVLACPGHSQTDLVYVGEDWAVTGDTLLRGVFQSPLLDVDLEKGGRFNNYQAYCRTIVKLSGLNGKKVLPSHRQTVKSIKSTLLFYVSKLLCRAEQLNPYRSEENVMLLIDKLLNGRVQDVFHMYLKASEIVFMKDFLNQPKLLRSALEEIGLFNDVSGLFYSAVQQ